MASSSVSQEDVDHDGRALAARKANKTKFIRSARANRTVNSYNRGEEIEREADSSDIPKYEVLVEQNDASPKPIPRILNKEKRCIPRGAHAGKSRGNVRDRRKLREKRRSTGLQHVPSTESTGNSTGEDENNENTIPVSTKASTEPEEKIFIPNARKSTMSNGKEESDIDHGSADADDEANNASDVLSTGKEDDNFTELKRENDRLLKIIETKDKRISNLENQIRQLTQKFAELSSKSCTNPPAPSTTPI